MKLRGGRPILDAALRAVIERELSQHVKRAGLALQGSIQRTTPVRTGMLRRSMAVDEPRWRGKAYSVKVGTNLIYARRVNVRGRSAGYIERGFEAGRAQAHAELKAGIKALAPHLWDRSEGGK